jgi:hypothetical protein
MLYHRKRPSTNLFPLAEGAIKRKRRKRGNRKRNAVKTYGKHIIISNYLLPSMAEKEEPFVHHLPFLGTNCPNCKDNTLILNTPSG